MTQAILFCDICGKEVPRFFDTKCDKSYGMTILINDLRTDSYLDICPTCYGQIIKYLELKINNKEGLEPQGE